MAPTHPHYANVDPWPQAAAELLRLLLPNRRHGCLCLNCIEEEIVRHSRVVIISPDGRRLESTDGRC